MRGPKREIISRVYNFLLRTVLSARFSDAQCGFKAGRADVIKALLPAVEDDSWFFDTELLMLAQRRGLPAGHPAPVLCQRDGPTDRALTGIGAVAFYQAYRRSGWWRLMLPLTIAVTCG